MTPAKRPFTTPSIHPCATAARVQLSARRWAASWSTMNPLMNRHHFLLRNYRFRRIAMSKRKTPELNLPGSTITVGLDIGYGVVKAVTDSQEVLFPSVMGHSREIKFQKEELAQRHPGDQLTEEDGSC